MGGRYHVSIGGQGFLVKPGSYRRSAVGANSEPRTQNSALGWREWSQADWRRGDGQRVADAGTRGSGDTGRWRGGQGVEIGTAGQLSLAPGLGLSYSSPESRFVAMEAFLGRLFALAGSSGKIYSFDGSAWTMAWDTGKAAMGSLARHGEKLYAGSDADGGVFVRDGVGWSTAFDVAGVAGITAMASCEVWDATAKASVQRLFLGCRMPSGEAKVYQWDGTTATALHGAREGRVEAMAVYGGRLFVATSDAGNGPQGRILCYDGRSASGEWTEVSAFSDDYVAGWTVFDNLLFCGSGVGGKVRAFDGSRLVEAYDLADQGVVVPGALRGLAVCGGRLYVGYEHPTQGAAVLCKLPAAVVLDPVMVVGGGSGHAEMESCRLGWSTPATVGTAGTVGALSVYQGELFLARDGAIYRRDPLQLQVSGVAQLSDIDGGDAGQPKLLRRVSVSHQPLGVGESVAVSYALDGSESYQYLEDFDGLARCNPAATTADWRTEDSLVRLKGMPGQTFAGKLPGNLTVPHLAYKLTSPNPNSSPGAFAGEFSAGDYSAVSGVDGAAAVQRGAGAGLYAHELFVFDLSGLNPAGIHPRGVAYGRGDSAGTVAPGVIFRIWNHRTGSWDYVGSNTAAAGDSEAARTIETVATEGWADYLGPDGKLYLGLRSSYPGGSVNPAEIGADYVGLDPLWAATGEAVSSVLPVPGSGTVTRATMTVVESTMPAGCALQLYLSADGASWESATSGVELAFAYPGDQLRWKVVLTGTGTATPTVGLLKVDCVTGTWVSLGTSDVEGSTGRVFDFGEGSSCRRLSWRVELAGPGGAESPVLTGIRLEYAPAVGAKRGWSMDVRCEGIPAGGVPLRLLDGTVEALSGVELSRQLWAARAREVVSFEDLDGLVYTVWFEGLEEALGELVGGAVQTVAKCRLVEC